MASANGPNGRYVPRLTDREARTDATSASDSDAVRCPACGGVMRIIEIIVPTACPYDTS